MAKVKQVATKPQKFMGDAMKATGKSEKKREEETELENSDEETETVAERARKRKGTGIAGLELFKKKKKMEKAPASKPFAQQNIFEPRYIKWDSFSDLPYEFEDLFTFQGWMEFSELNEYYYPYLIQEFYGSMKEGVKGESFSVKVKKKSHIIDVDFLASVLNLPNDGNRIGTFKDTRKLEGYDEKAFQLSIFSEGKEESKLAEDEEVEKNVEKEESAKEESEAEQEPDKEKSRESSSSHTNSNSSSENGKSEGRNGSRQEEEKEDADKKKEE
ncbi:hypothetical protein GH714_013245 [Hevea brasiliensis]|uniref:Uncharacterized protein n=1 Tax=Hevea brasiliensis TaxID=3981 RepID=A0A6A6KDR1_HEVBR|nr:hypothetical protein GH714_013245 [Hevea brasiliensis]